MSVIDHKMINGMVSMHTNEPVPIDDLLRVVAGLRQISLGGIMRVVNPGESAIVEEACDT